MNMKLLLNKKKCKVRVMRLIMNVTRINKKFSKSLGMRMRKKCFRREKKSNYT